MINARLFSLSLLFASAVPAVAAETRTRYHHGDPTPDEQYMLELINRARANPASEGKFLTDSGDSDIEFAVDYFKVDLDRVREDFSSYPVRPPLAFSPFLMRSARAHSEDMAKQKFQDHDSSDGTSFVSRIADTDYPYRGVAENVYSMHVPNPLFAHAGFNIDWGPGSGGIQAGVGHRLNMMNFKGTLFKEVGIGVVERDGSGVKSHGKLAITQDFGLRQSGEALLLGVVYSDKNSNEICDPGEGISGVKVSPSVGNHYAITSTSGGYAIPFDSPSSGVLTFSGGGIGTEQTRSFSIREDNLKVDLVTASDGPVKVRIDVADRSAKETGGSAKFRVRRNGSNNESLTVVIRRSKGNSRGKASYNDYKLSGKVRGANGNSRNFRVTIPAGKSSVAIRLKAVNDRKKEPKEKVTFEIKPKVHYEIKNQPKAKIFISR